MKRASLLFFCLASAAGDERLLWQIDGYPRLFEAAARARNEGKRLLLGLSGSPT